MGRPLIAVLLTVGACGSLAAQAPDSVTVPAGSRYVARGPLGWLSKFMFGSRYRDLWGTPVTLPRLDPAARNFTPIGADTGLRAGYLYFRDGAGATPRRSRPRAGDRSPRGRAAGIVIRTTSKA